MSLVSREDEKPPPIVRHMQMPCLVHKSRKVAMRAGEVANGASRADQYDLGSPSAFSAIKFRIICGLTGAMRGM